MIFYINVTKGLIIGHNPLTDEIVEFKMISDGQAIEQKSDDLKDEIEKTVNKKRAKKIMKVIKKSGKKWHKDYDCCVECGTTETKYEAKGICQNCYQRAYNRKKAKLKKKELISKRAKTDNDFMPTSSAVSQYQCEECKNIFNSASDYKDVRCDNPECKSKKVIKLP